MSLSAERERPMRSAFALQRVLTVATAHRAGVESIAWSLWNCGADLATMTAVECHVVARSQAMAENLKPQLWASHGLDETLI
jgi:hypothetical protein